MTEGSSIKGGGPRGKRRIPRAAVLVLAVWVVLGVGAPAWTLVAPVPDRTIVLVDGSSTVFPVTSAWAEVLNARSSAVQYIVGFSGTGAGFEKLCDGRIHLADASRPVTTREVEKCRANGIEPVEFQVAYDGLSVVVSRANDWVTALTVGELCRMWADTADEEGCGGAGPRVTRWNELDPAWPDERIVLYGPGTDSGTFDYFVEVIVAAFRHTVVGTDEFFPSEDDNLLVEGVARDRLALGYFGVAYAVQNEDRLRIVAIDPEDGRGAVLPTMEAIESGLYAPLSRPLFVYADAHASLHLDAVQAFIRFGLGAEGQDLVLEVGYVSLPPEAREKELGKLP